MADFTKCRSGYNYREGSAVSVQPNIASPATKINSVTHGKANKDWAPFFTIVAPRWDNIGYYYNEHP